MATVEDTNPHHGKEVVGSIGVVIDSTEKRCRRILADHLGDEVPTSWMFFHEVGDIVDEPCNQNEGSFGRLLPVWEMMSGVSA